MEYGKVILLPQSLAAVLASEEFEIDFKSEMHEAFQGVGYAKVAQAICLAPLAQIEQELLAA